MHSRPLVAAALVWLLAGVACEGPVLQLPKKNGRTSGPVWVDLSGKHLPSRSFRIERASDLLPGASARGRIGDFKLDNGRVAFVVAQAGSPLGLAETGGELVDAAPAGGQDALGQLMVCLEDGCPRQPAYTAVEAGRRGEVALVRAFGHDSQDPSIEIESEYALRPEANALEITTIVVNRGNSARFGYRVDDGIEWGRTEPFVPGAGLSPRGQLDGAGGVLYALGDEVAYAWVADADRAPGRHADGKSELQSGKIDLAPGQPARVRRWLVVGGPSVTEVAETAAALRKQPVARLRGRAVQETTGLTVGDVRLFLDDSAGHPVAVTRSTADGYELVAAPGDYKLRAEAPGRRGPVDLDVSLRGATTLDVLLSRPGAVSFEVRSSGTPAPARVTFARGVGDGAPRLGPPFGDELRAGSVVYTVDGTGKIDVPPGRYRLVASRGPMYTVDVKDIEVPPGKGRAPHVVFDLEPAVDVRGLTCVDLHAHAQPSADSAVSLRDRAASVLGEGLDALVADDHDQLVDWAQALSSLHTPRELPFVSGEEATSDSVGHFAVLPLSFKAEARRGGALDVAGKTAHELMTLLEAPDRVVVVEHPRRSKVGYFDLVKLDPRSDTLPADWEGGFDAVEIFAGKDVSAVEGPLHDWFWLLDHGLTYTAVGGSDAHTLAGEEVGWPRTCVPQKEGQSVAETLVSSLKTRHDALVTNGPFVRVQVAGRGMGQLAPAPKGRARLDIEVQAAPWIDVSRLEVFVSGERRGKPIQIPPSKERLRYRGSIDLRVTEDAWVVVLARGDASLEPVVSRRDGGPPPLPLAITNPIYLDHNLDGKYLPPRSFSTVKAPPRPSR